MASASVPLNSAVLYIQEQLTRYVYSFFLVFGVTGCCLNILLLSRRQFRTSSCCTYLLAMSGAMVVHLIVALGLYLYALDHVDLTTSVLAVCKLRIYTLQSTSMIYRWCLTAACFDRYALSPVTVRLRNLAKIHFACRVLVGIIVIWLILPVHTLIFYNLRGNVCGIVYSIVAAFYHSTFTTITGGVLPVVIMLMCTICIYRNLVLKRQRRHGLSVNEQSTARIRGKDTQSRRDRQVLFMLLIQVLVYGILITPLMSWYFYSATTLNVPNKSPDRVAIERLLFFTVELIMYIFPVSSFYLYTLSSSIFRAELLMMIRNVLICKWMNETTRIEPVTHENPIRTVSGHVTKGKPMQPPCHLDRAKLERAVEIVE